MRHLIYYQGCDIQNQQAKNLDIESSIIATVGLLCLKRYYLTITAGIILPK